MRQLNITGLLSMIFATGLLQGANWEIFEGNSITTGWIAGSGNSLSLNSDEPLQGEQSLEWNWSGSSPSVQYTGESWDSGGYVNCFSFWVHMDTPIQSATLEVSFLHGSNVVKSFAFGLDFAGWRTAFVPYRDMQGNGSGQIDTLRLEVVGASIPASGRILIDQIVFSKIMDSRHQYSDVQVPFVRIGLEKDHWEPRVEESGKDPQQSYSPTTEEVVAGTLLEGTVESAIAGNSSVSTSMVDSVELEVAGFGLERIAGQVRGNHIFYNSYPGMAYPSDLRAIIDAEGKNHDFRQYGVLQLKIARYYHGTDDPGLKLRLADLFILMAEHLLNQGWAAGSNQGCIHHIGYQIREYFQANFLMRDVLRDAGLLEATREAVQWYSRAGQLLDTFIEPNLDYYNTIAWGQLLGLLMEEDPTMRASWLKAFQDALSTTLATVMPGDGLGLKPDGTAFHHNGHYPAYAIGAFNTLGIVFEHLRETPFQPGISAQRSFRRALLASRIYSQKFDWPIGISGRHPFDGNIQSLQQAFTAMAAYPDPVTGITPDPAVSSALLRLWGNPGGDLGAAIDSAGLIPDTTEGFWSFPFAAQAVARGPNWMASMKGYSRYVWSSEIYTRDNRYGRYQSNGSLEILREGGRIASGFRQSGWDWNRLPGTTGIHLPLEELESPLTSTLMLRSNETFAGAASLGQQVGIFGVILNEPYFGNDLKARKSVCMLGDMMIALGSGISSTNTTYPTETTIFQTTLDSADTPQIFGSGIGEVTGLDISRTYPATEGLWFTDPIGTGYWLAPGQLLKWHRMSQDSFHNKTKAPTTGNFSAAWLNHRNAPVNGTYHYAILPDASPASLETFHQDMKSANTARYAVLSQTNSLHAVWDNQRQTLFVASFDSSPDLGLPLLLAVSHPLLVVIRDDSLNLRVAVSNPDLKPTSSGHILSTNHLLLSGLWIPEPAEDYLFWHESGNTRLVVPTAAGISAEVELTPAEEPLPFSGLTRNGTFPQPELIQVNPSSSTLAWEAASDPERSGWILEKLDPETGEFQPVAVLDAGKRSWIDPNPVFNQLTAYRLTEWTMGELGPSSAPVPVYLRTGFVLEYDFRNMDSIDQLWADGWTVSGIPELETDLWLAPEGLLIRDNSPTDPAAITLPFQPREAGLTEAVLGVFATSNFFVNLTLLHDETELMSIELTTRTEGVIEKTGGNQSFTDTSWDMRDGPPRKVALSWQISPDNQFSIQGSFHPLEGEPVTAQSGLFSVNQLPNKVRISVGYGTAVNRGGLVQSFSLKAADPVDTIPLSALPGSPHHALVTTGTRSFSLRFSDGPSPLDCGLQLIGETSTDLQNWSPFIPGGPGISDGQAIDYTLPELDGQARFYHFEMAP